MAAFSEHKVQTISAHAASDQFKLAGGAVHLWRAVLEQEPERLAALAATLAPEEQARAARFYFPRHRAHFIAARGLLRELLARYLAAPPAALRFTYGPYGKPALAAECATADLHFNVSHSGGQALYAVAHGRAVGVDIEEIKPDNWNLTIAQHFFSAREQAALQALPSHLQTQAFFNCWTRKEAYLKATGAGLTLRLDAFDVSLAPGEPAALLRNEDDPQAVHRWSLQELDVGDGYAAALAVAVGIRNSEV
jgi:4'-phosphopantetheinyl transferase